MRVELKLINTLTTKLSLSSNVISSGGGGGPAYWGSINGDIEDQQDLIEFIEGKGYISEIPLEYVKREELNFYQPIGNYLTEIPSEYVTENELSDKGYLTNIPDTYVQREELSSYQPKGNYITEIPEDYITETELLNKGYATQDDLSTALGDIEAVLDNIIGS